MNKTLDLSALRSFVGGCRDIGGVTAAAGKVNFDPISRINADQTGVKRFLVGN